MIVVYAEIDVDYEPHKGDLDYFKWCVTEMAEGICGSVVKVHVENKDGGLFG